jgi:NADH-quinone oxidoreductase subunit J
MEKIIFYILSAVVILFSVLCVTSRRILRAAVYLLFVLLSAAGIFFMMSYHFLAAVQITVYAGGIIVLFIFSIMLTSHVDEKLDQPSFKKILFSLIAVIAGAAVSVSTILSYKFPAPSNKMPDSSIETIGKSLLNYQANGYALPFEVISILLLAAIVGTIMITRRDETR